MISIHHPLLGVTHALEKTRPLPHTNIDFFPLGWELSDKPLKAPLGSEKNSPNVKSLPLKKAPLPMDLISLLA